jgi:hypothetical protein
MFNASGPQRADKLLIVRMHGSAKALVVGCRGSHGVLYFLRGFGQTLHTCHEYSGFPS